MVDLPADADGLSWIASRDPSQLLLIPGLQSASIVAAAAGDQQALAYVRFTAQQFAAYGTTCTLNPLELVSLAASKLTGRDANSTFITALNRKDPQLANLLEVRRITTEESHLVAACDGELSALMWMKAICPWSFVSESTTLMSCAAEHGQLQVLQYLRSGSAPEHWDEYVAEEAAPHLDCIKWLLSTEAPGGPCPFHLHILSSIARRHGLSALQWFHANCTLPAELWNEGLLSTAARMADQAMLEWLRAQTPPVPWSEQVTRAAAGADLKSLQWLRTQDPLCPWAASSCSAAARSGRMDVLVCERSQNPPCPWNEQCTEVAAKLSNPEMMHWLHQNGCPLSPNTARAAILCGDVSMLKWLHSAGCPLDSGCLGAAAIRGNLPILKWLCEQGCQLTTDLYGKAAHSNHRHILQFLHQKVPLTRFDPEDWRLYRVTMTMLMFWSDMGWQLLTEQHQKLLQARRAHCAFHGLVRWCRRAVSDPSRGGHRAFNFQAEDGSGQMLLTRLCLLPPELIRKIAVAAELQHDIFDPPG